MQTRHSRLFAGVMTAVAVVMFAGFVAQARAERSGASTALVGNTGGSVVGIVLHDPPPPPPPPPHRDSANKARQDSINHANHVRDSINHARMDSLMKSGGHRDSTKTPPPPPPHNDSLMRARLDSLNKLAHERDSINHARMDSLKNLPRDTTHRPDPPHIKRDSVIKNLRDSIHAREIRFKHRIDSLIHIIRDSLHTRDTSGHGGTPDGTNQNALALQGSPVATPTAVTLAQNFPNPFGGTVGTTSIDFTLPSEQGVNLSVYNAAGQYVTTLVRGQLSAGTHTTTFDGANLPAGIYFYKLVTEQGTMTNRMIKVH